MLGKLGRWGMPLLAGLAAVLLLGGFLAMRFHFAEAGLAILFGGGFTRGPVRKFAAGFSLTLLLPFYMIAGFTLWLETLALASAALPRFSRDWKPFEGFALTLVALAWTHLFLWWQVPTTLWLLPGLASVPFWLLFPLLLALTLGYPVWWLRSRGASWLRGGTLLTSWLLAWSLLPWAPTVLPRLLTPSRGGTDRARVLIIGLDGLREDVGQACTSGFHGTAYPDAYTIIPATRLLWHILWGGDPMFFTVGHAPPAISEFTGEQPLPIIQEADRKGWKPRFYIDDGGTIGLTGRPAQFDDVLMPAPGWENFINSNLSANFPLFAVWENWGRAFPTTNPWAPLDGGLKEALRLGRGSRLVMFHSCLAHTPVFLRRFELAKLSRWWTLTPRALEPWMARQQVTEARARNYDWRRDPFQAYRIRMESILKSWEPIWNQLDQDPQFKDANRVLFSDHGERFYHITPTIRLGGTHGYNLDPWEARIMLKVAGPGFDGPAKPQSPTISVLSLRDALDQAIQTDGHLSRTTLEAAYPVAPLRYHVVSTELFTSEPPDLYRQMDLKDLATLTGIAPGGIWFTQYQRSFEERSEDVSVAFATGTRLEVVKPLKGGGAHRFVYEGYEMKSADVISEDDYKAEKLRAKSILTSHQPGSPSGLGKTPSKAP